MGGSLHALVVDDENNIRSVIRKMLYQMGRFESVADAADGEEAWGKLRTEHFDLVITDINMPKLDGVGLLKRCQADAELKDIPFLMITGEATSSWVAIAGEWGAYDYLIKPFSYNVLRVRVEAILERLRSPEEQHYRKVQELKDAGDWGGALDSIEQWEKLMQRNIKARWLVLKGDILLEIGQYKDSAGCFEKAMALAPNFLAAYKGYSALQQRLGNTEKAVEVLEHVDRISPMDADRKMDIGRMMLEVGRTEEAKEYLDQAIRQTPARDKETAMLAVAETYMKNGLFDAADQIFSQNLKNYTMEIEVFNRLGITLRRQGKYGKAIECYRMALKHHPSNPAVYYNLGIVYMMLQDNSSARKCFTSALELDPGFAKAEEMLGQLRESSPGAESE